LLSRKTFRFLDQKEAEEGAKEAETRADNEDPTAANLNQSRCNQCNSNSKDKIYSDSNGESLLCHDFCEVDPGKRSQRELKYDYVDIDENQSDVAHVGVLIRLFVVIILKEYEDSGANHREGHQE
jgi:hypothetical protein